MMIKKFTILVSCTVLVILLSTFVAECEGLKEFGQLQGLKPLVTEDINNAPKNHSYTLGHWSKFYRLYYSVCIKKSAKWFWRITTAYCEVPEPGVFPLGVIRYIAVKDLDNNGNGGYAYLVHGGVNTTRARFYLKSQRGKPLDFIIEFYGT